MTGKSPQPDSSWDAYQRKLSQTKDSVLYRVLGPLRSLVYGDSLKRREADAIRSDTQSRFETLRETGDDLKTKLENQARTPLRQGDPLDDDAITTLTELEDTVTEIRTLLSNKNRFLTTTEQSQLHSLRDKSQDLITRVQEKHEIDKELHDIENNVQDLTTDVDHAIRDSDDALVKEEITSNIERVQARVNTINNVTHGTDISQPERYRRDDLAGDLEALHDRVTNHNDDVVQYEADAVLEDIITTTERLGNTINNARTADKFNYAETHDDVLEDKEAVIARINALTNTQKCRYLTTSQIHEFEKHRDQIQKQAGIVEKISSFNTAITGIRPTVEALQKEVNETLDFTEYLTKPESKRLNQKRQEVQANINSLRREIDMHDLFDVQQTELNQLNTSITDLRDDIASYNDKFVKEKSKEYQDVFSEIGDDNLSLNEQQELAVYRNDVHNQVNAGAGTGKTFSLSCRVKYLVEEGVAEEDILALTFLRDAADEMAKKVEDNFNINGAELDTLHALGNKILSRKDPSRIQLENQARLREINRIRRYLLEEDDEFRENYEEFETLFEDAKLTDDQGEKKDYVYSLKHISGRTKLGEDIEVDNNEEGTAHTKIADELFNHDITYRYQQYAAWADDPGGNAYIPDFTLPNYDFYIEFMPSEKVRQEKEPFKQKRTQEELNKIFEEYNEFSSHVVDVQESHVCETKMGSEKNLLTIRVDEIKASEAGEIVIGALEDSGIPTDGTLSEEDRVNRLYRANKLTRKIEAEFEDFIKKAKLNQIDPEEARSGQIDEEGDPELYYFTLAATRVLQAYNEQYNEYNAYDFVDMIVDSKEAVENGQVDDIASFEHIIVDEFQDLNLVQINFVQALLGRGDDTRLFAVGDDWQSIYGFKAARPEYFINFDDHFGPSTETPLELNYRCPPSVVQSGNTLIKNNDAKTEKTVRAASSEDAIPQIHNVPGKDDFQYESNAVKLIVDLVRESVRKHNRDEGEIMVLARNREGSPFIPRVRSGLQNIGIDVGGSDGVRVMTAHNAKGGEAEHVIVANATGGEHDGFPPEERDRNLTEVVETNTGSHIDEERRLFYVALTRAKERLDIQTRVWHRSPFLDEINEHVSSSEVGVDCRKDRVCETVTVIDEIKSNDNWKTRQIGTIETDDGFKLGFAIDDGTSHELLVEDWEYRVSNAKIDEHDGEPQLKIDSKTTIKP